MMKKGAVVLVLFLFLLSSCSVGKENRDSDSIEKEDSSEDEKSYACKENPYTINIEGYVHTVFTAISKDGKTWTDAAYVMSGSVPEGFFFQDRIYLIVGNACLFYVSDDGVSFEGYDFTVQGKDLPKQFMKLGVDPTVLVDGETLRLFFYEPTTSNIGEDPARIAGEHPLVQYISSDAIQWEKIGEAIAIDSVTDPDIVLFEDEYLLYASKGSSVVGSSSSDGEIYTLKNEGGAVQSYGGVSDTLVDGNVLHMYVHAFDGTQTSIYLLESSDGLSWENLGVVLKNGESPSVLKLSDGTYRMYFVRRLTEEEFASL